MSATPASEGYALVMKGGGLKGLACVGAFAELQPFYRFDLYVGTSAGAIIAALLGADYTADEMEKLLRQMNFADFLSERFRVITNCIFYGGMFQGLELTNWVDTTLAQKLKSPTRVKFKNLPHAVRIYACKRDTDALIFDSVQSHEMSVAYAVRCSVAIPFFFTPEKDQGLNVFDGGMRHNYPVKKLLEQTPGKPFIGLYLGDPIYTPRKPSLLRDLLSISAEATDIEALESYRSETVVIDPKPITTLDFSLSSEEKNFLVLQGRAAALEFLYGRGQVDRSTMEAAAERARSAKGLALTARRKRTFRKKLIVGLMLAMPMAFYLGYAAVQASPPPHEIAQRVSDFVKSIYPPTSISWVALPARTQIENKKNSPVPTFVDASTSSDPSIPIEAGQVIEPLSVERAKIAGTTWLRLRIGDHRVHVPASEVSIAPPR